MTTTTMTPATRQLFAHLVEDAGNWGGTPLVDLTPEGKGNLTHLKKLGLVTTFMDRSDMFVSFTAAGAELAKREFNTEL